MSVAAYMTLKSQCGEHPGALCQSLLGGAAITPLQDHTNLSQMQTAATYSALNTTTMGLLQAKPLVVC
jgi:hypothetical protein